MSDFDRFSSSWGDAYPYLPAAYQVHQAITMWKPGHCKSFTDRLFGFVYSVLRKTSNTWPEKGSICPEGPSFLGGRHRSCGWPRPIVGMTLKNHLPRKTCAIFQGCISRSGVRGCLMPIYCFFFRCFFGYIFLDGKIRFSDGFTIYVLWFFQRFYNVLRYVSMADVNKNRRKRRKKTQIAICSSIIIYLYQSTYIYTIYLHINQHIKCHWFPMLRTCTVIAGRPRKMGRWKSDRKHLETMVFTLKI